MLPENILNTWTAWDFLAKVAGMQLLQAGRPGNQFYASFASGTWEKKRSGKCHPWFFFGRHPSLLLSTAQSTQSPLEKKKKHSLPKETKKGKNKQRNGSSCSEAPTGLSHHEQGGPSLPTHTLPPLGRGRARTRGPLTRRPAARLHGGRRPRAPTPAAAAGRYGTAPRDAAQRRSFPGVLSFPCRSSPLCSLAFFFFRIKITVLPPFEVLRCVPLGLKYQQPEQLKLPLAREK